MSFFAARVLLCLMLCGLGVYMGAMVARLVQWDNVLPAAISTPARAEMQLPSTRLSPNDVVRLQVNALRAFQHDRTAIDQCYVLASPANRAMTGPLDRFTAMVQNPIYSPLVRQVGALVGRPVIRGEQATVLVTVLDTHRTARVFRFFLSKQTDPPYLDCWMTDAVIPAAKQSPTEQERAPGPVAAA